MPGTKAVGLLALIICFAGSGCGSGGAVSTPSDSPSTECHSAWNTVEVTGSAVNLRAGPGTEYAVLARVGRGDTLQVTGGTSDWYRVYVPDMSLFAWIYSRLTTGTELP
ncbi:MAG: SH3 domain-containing protein [Candidatus Fermentibacteraceae bacterium]|nr:SH3 domain-containing protein [Candidatus Fermentibacteraceae bacterium]